jgi:asparagine synthase (glutamine-hydrolysing)
MLNDNSSNIRVNHVVPNMMIMSNIYNNIQTILSNIDLITRYPTSFIDNENLLLEDVFHSVEKEVKMNINSLLKNSVKTRLNDLIENNIEYGVLLSGGLDSSLIAGLVSKFSNKQIKTFSVGVNEYAPDLIKAREVAKYINSCHTEYYISKYEILNNLENLINCVETYDVTTVRASSAMYLLIQKIKNDFPDIKVLFSGELSDELFCYLYGFNAPSKKDFQNETYNLTTSVYKYDCLRANKTSMENGVEIRLPFTDKHFVNYCLHISPELKMFTKENGKMEKQILRDSFKDDNLIPMNILYRKKEQFSDGVSCLNDEDNMISYLKEHTNNNELNFYKNIFNKKYSNCTNLVSIWKPKWSENEDPSGRIQSFWHKN